jgi:DNA-binding NarL/FixJ family response regulator
MTRDGPSRPLTPTELRVARLVSIGYDRPRMASLLGMAESTVGCHVCNIAAKLPNPDGLKPYTLVLLWAAHQRWLEERIAAA